MIPDAGMKILRKAVKAIGAEGQNHLRSSKCIARLHRIIESVLLQADERADLIKLVLLHLCLKASAVHKCHTPAASCFLRGLRVRQNHHRIILVTGSSSAASKFHGSMGQRLSLIHPVHTVSSMERDQIIIAGHKIQAGAHDFVKINPVTAAIFNEHAAGDHIRFRKHAVQQSGFHLVHGVFQYDLQSLGLRLIGVNSRQTVKGVLALPDLVPCIAKVTAAGLVCIYYGAGHISIIAKSGVRKFLRQSVHGIGPVHSGIIRVTGKTPVCVCQKIVHTPFCSPSVI